jgi:hypothetical protein
LNEYSSDVKHKRNKDESNRLRIAEKKSADVRPLDIGEMRDDQQVGVTVQDKLQVLFPK